MLCQMSGDASVCVCVRERERELTCVCAGVYVSICIAKTPYRDVAELLYLLVTNYVVE